MKKEYGEEEYPLKDLTEKIIAAAFKVHNTLGSGFVEKFMKTHLQKNYANRCILLNNRKRFQLIIAVNLWGNLILIFLSIIPFS